MNDKSYVGMAHRLCPICGTKHDEAVLLDKHLRPRLERENFMGYALCPACAPMAEEHIALIGVSDDPGANPAAVFTGSMVWVRRSVVGSLIPMLAESKRPFVYVAPGVVDRLHEIQQELERNARAAFVSPADKEGGV